MVGTSRTGMKGIDRISEVLNSATKCAAGFLAAAMTVLVFLQVLFRYVLNSPLDWSEECASFAFVWMSLLGASIGLRNDQHPRLDIFFNRFPLNLQKIVKALINLAVVFMLVVLFFFGLKLTLSMRMQVTAALGYSVSFVYVVLPISALIMIIHVVVQTLLLFRRGSEGEQE
jgi:TRAP-type C4-dicarboxylate transport system permease small subunit